jgi:hypothetical protein
VWMLYRHEAIMPNGRGDWPFSPSATG